MYVVYLLLPEDQQALWFDRMIRSQILSTSPLDAILKSFPNTITSGPGHADVMPLPIIDKERQLCNLEEDKRHDVNVLLQWTRTQHFHCVLHIPCHLSISPSRCFPTLWGPARWLDPELRRRKVCPPLETRWTWATCTLWGRTSLANSSSLLRTCSWFSVGTWAGIYPEACFLSDLWRINRSVVGFRHFEDGCISFPNTDISFPTHTSWDLHRNYMLHNKSTISSFNLAW